MRTITIRHTFTWLVTILLYLLIWCLLPLSDPSLVPQQRGSIPIYLAGILTAYSTYIFWGIGLWTLFIISLLFYQLAGHIRPRRRAQLQFALLWTSGIIILMPITYLLCIFIEDPSGPQNPLSSWSLVGITFVFLISLWSIAVFLMLIYSDIEFINFYGKYLIYHRGVWTVFAISLAVTILAGYSGYIVVLVRTNFAESVPALRDPIQKLMTSTYNNWALASRLEMQTGASQQTAFDMENFRKELRETQTTISETHELVSMAQKSLFDIRLNSNSSIEFKTVFGETSDLISHVLTSTQEEKRFITYLITATESLPDLAAINQEIAELGTYENSACKATLSSLGEAINCGLVTPAADAYDNANLAAQTVDRMPVARASTFLWRGVFFTTFVLFPWVLLLMFLTRKRKNVATQIVMDLHLLDPDDDLLKKVLNLTSEDEPPLSANDRVEHLADKAFNNIEYILGLILLSSLSALGWYYIFYPFALSGLINQMTGNIDVRHMTQSFIGNITPLTAGFAGAYFYAAQMLFRRYLSDDLYPAAFLQAGVRMVIVYILTLAVSVIAGIDITQDNPEYRYLCGAGFLIGIFPDWGLSLIAKLFDKAAMGVEIAVPRGLDVRQPLLRLDGITIWTEARLLEEGIENIQSMATASIEQLVTNTHYSTAQIVDWIDQAILYLHSGANGEWFWRFQAVGIRTATDLLDTAGVNLLDPDLNWQTDFRTIKGKLTNLEAIRTAMNDAPLESWAKSWTSANLHGTPGNGPPMLTIEMLQQICDTIWPDQNMQYIINYFNQMHVGSLQPKKSANPNNIDTDTGTIASGAEPDQTGVVGAMATISDTSRNGQKEGA